MARIADLIEVPPVKTVIQMSDIDNPQLRDFLTESFLLTDEVSQVLESFFDSVINENGQGFFLEGNYGSGKSHLLTVISLLLSSPQSWQPLLTQDNMSKILTTQKENLDNRNYLILNISLVEHSSREYLEDIIVQKINEKLEEQSDIISDVDIFDISNKDDYRRLGYFEELNNLLVESHFDGLIILVDELSEFLRSKSDGRRFNEDVRFLQFLGEFSLGANCWLMATLQEGIEKTGEIVQEVFRKIKDRFPAHFHLTGTHIEEIVSKRLIQKKPGVIETILKIYRYYNDSFSDWTVEKELFINLYPVNPMTIKLLDNLKPLFSQHRGIIDFIHYRLQGDPSRSIRSMMDEPAEKLLNPDLVFDHFLDRIRENMETRQYYEKAYRYYEQEIESILSEEEVETGLKLIKLLVLLSVSPIEKKYNVIELSHMLLKPVTDLDSTVNYDYLDEILQRLYRHGAYLVREEGESSKESIYYLDLKADVNLIIDQKTEYIKSNFFEEEQRIFTRVGQLINESYLPLTELIDKPRSYRTVHWQNTERQGYFLLLSFTEITLKGIDEFNKRLNNINSEKNRYDFKDFVIFTAHPLQIEKQRAYLKDVIMPELSAEERASYCFWIPEELERTDLLKNVLARILLLEEYRRKNGETALSVREKLESMLEEDRNNVISIYRQSFFRGKLIDGNGQQVLDLDSVGILTFEDLLKRITSVLLENRYPNHYRISPNQLIINEGQINRLVENFIGVGEIEKKTASSLGLLKLIENILTPLNIIKSRGQKIRLNVNPAKNPLLKAVFSRFTEERNNIDDIYKYLRKGSYGLSRPQFKIIILILLYTGYLTAYSEKQKMALSQINVYNFERIKYLGYGEIIEEDFQLILKECQLLPPRFKDQPFSLPLQQDIWVYLTELKREMVDEINRIKVKLTNYTLDGGLEYLNHERLLNNLDKINNLLEEIKVSYSADEGLERFASAYGNTPNIDNYLERYKLIKSFVKDGYQKLLEMKNYLEGIPDDLPERNSFAEIKEIKGELLESIKDQAVVFSEGFLEGLLDRFEYLKKLYIEAYYSEHQKTLSGERFSLYSNIEKSKDYQVLNSLSGIDLISVKDDMIKVQRMLAKVLRQRCRKLNREFLKRSPHCICGFVPGEKIESVPLEELHSVISSGIAQYLSALDNEEYRKKIEEYLKSMEAVGEKRFARPVRELLKTASLNISELDSDLIESMYKILNRNVIHRINQALAGSISLYERNLDQLYENLVGRSFSLDQIRDIFEDWLRKDQSMDKYSYIKVISSDSIDRLETDENDSKIVEDYIEELFPEMLAYYDQLGEELYSLFTASLIWAEYYDINITELASIINCPHEFYREVNKDTVIQFWSKARQEKYQQVFENLKKNIKRKLENNSLLQELTTLMPLGDLEDMIIVLEKEFISFDLIREILILLIKRTENGLSEKSPNVYLKRIETAVQSTSSEEKTDYLGLLRSYLQLASSLSVLEKRNKLLKTEQGSILMDRGQSSTTVGEWNSIYRNHLSHLEYNLAVIKRIAAIRLLTDRIPLEKLSEKVKQELNYYMKEFHEFSQDKLFRVNEEASAYLQREVKYVTELDLSELILEKFPGMTRRMNNQDICCILMDGMRQDNWRLIKEELKGKLPIRIIKEGLLYANHPTNTEIQIERLKENGFRGDIINSDEYLSLLKDRENNKRNITMINEIIKFSYIDDKVHSSKENYAEFMEEVRFQTQNRLIPFLNKIPERTLILIVSDHGYRINYQYSKSEKYESPRYLHGGNSPQEIIVPWALIYKP